MEKRDTKTERGKDYWVRAERTKKWGQGRDKVRRVIANPRRIVERRPTASLLLYLSPSI